MKIINLTNQDAAQDMVTIIMAEKSLSAPEAIKFSINKTIFKNILKAGYASIALGLWGHDEPERDWDELDNPIIEVEFDTASEDLIGEVMKQEDVNFETAVAYFLLFTMEALGYHI